jgi:hypothetical protein
MDRPREWALSLIGHQHTLNHLRRHCHPITHVQFATPKTHALVHSNELQIHVSMQTVLRITVLSTLKFKVSPSREPSIMFTTNIQEMSDIQTIAYNIENLQLRLKTPLGACAEYFRPKNHNHVATILAVCIQRTNDNRRSVFAIYRAVTCAIRTAL